MKKLRLKVDALEVQGFATEEVRGARGTVRGAGHTAWNELSCVPDTCWGTSCEVRCATDEVDHTHPCFC